MVSDLGLTLRESMSNDSPWLSIAPTTSLVRLVELAYLPFVLRCCSWGRPNSKAVVVNCTCCEALWTANWSWVRVTIMQNMMPWFAWAICHIRRWKLVHTMVGIVYMQEIKVHEMKLGDEPWTHNCNGDKRHIGTHCHESERKYYQYARGRTM